MSVHSFKLLDFPASAAQNPTMIPRSKIAAGLFAVVNTNSTSSLAIGQNNPAKRRTSNFHSPIKRREALLGISLTLALHLLWFFTAPVTEKQEAVTPPQPIMVEWLSNSQSQAEPVKPPSQPTPKIVKPAVKPKVQPRKVAVIPPKPVIATSSTATTATITKPIEIPPVPATTIAVTNPAPAATSASPNSSADDAPVTLPHLNADYLNNPAPDYPPASRELSEQGRVLLRAMINTDGTVAQVVLRKSSGFDRLDQAALDTVKNWRFVPAQRGEQKVSAWVVVPVAFSLEG
ncbi:MAG: energy transducer TonB [Methylococcaceae bacterium]|nr:energy transducer TonB [Methylococcaceae bacterium]MDP3905109.1 energy transducer TonB [Methylococcaceae bacterium]